MQANQSWIGVLKKCGLCLLMSLPLAAAADYSAHPKAQVLMDELVDEHQFDRAELQAWFSQAKKKPSILEAIARPAEKRLEWKDYRKIFVTDSRTQKGEVFWRDNAETLARAEQTYGVPAEIIVAIIGVETRYGQNKGSYRVIDALSTLAFDYPPRAKFFRKELLNFMLLAREQSQSPVELLGSYAGAMGYGQFMPSSFRHYAVDFDGDQLADIWQNPVDAIGSVANYFVRHGWRQGQSVVVQASASKDYKTTKMNKLKRPSVPLSEWSARGLIPQGAHEPELKAMPLQLEGKDGSEFWLGMKNFYVITRYNHSHMYAMAVYQLSQAIKQQYQKSLDAAKPVTRSAG